MRELVYAFAIIAAAASTAAVAKDLKQDKKAAVPMVKATVMSDAEMDKISAGSAPKEGYVGLGESTAHYWARGTATPAVQPLITLRDAFGTCVGVGINTGLSTSLVPHPCPYP